MGPRETTIFCVFGITLYNLGQNICICWECLDNQGTLNRTVTLNRCSIYSSVKSSVPMIADKRYDG